MSNSSQMVCPNCNAEIAADDTQIFVYCRYCGVEIQTQDIVEVRPVNVSESLEKMAGDGETYLKVEEYFLAEQKFREVIKKYPQQRAGYEGLIRTITRDGTEYSLLYEEEVYRLLRQIKPLIREEEAAEFEQWRKQIFESFQEEHARVEERLKDKEDNLLRTRKEDCLIYSILVMTVVFMVAGMFLIVQLFPPIPVFLGGLAITVVALCFIWRKVDNL